MIAAMIAETTRPASHDGKTVIASRGSTSSKSLMATRESPSPVATPSKWNQPWATSPAATAPVQTRTANTIDSTNAGRRCCGFSMAM